MAVFIARDERMRDSFAALMKDVNESLDVLGKTTVPAATGLQQKLTVASVGGNPPTRGVDDIPPELLALGEEVTTFAKLAADLACDMMLQADLLAQKVNISDSQGRHLTHNRVELKYIDATMSNLRLKVQIEHDSRVTFGLMFARAKPHLPT